jgi:hypothetical protein
MNRRYTVPSYMTLWPEQGKLILLRTRCRKSVTSADPRSLNGALVDEKFRRPNTSELSNNNGTELPGTLTKLLVVSYFLVRFRLHFLDNTSELFFNYTYTRRKENMQSDSVNTTLSVCKTSCKFRLYIAIIRLNVKP